MLQGDDVLVIADDNLFDFSLEGLVKRFNCVDDNTLVVRNERKLNNQHIGELNFARCNVDRMGKIISASYSFLPGTHTNKGMIICDLYLVHRKRIDNLSENYIGKEWFKDFYAWEAKDGFWADIGKFPLRKEAERYFNSLKD